jgi:hypothetical protein
MAALVLAGSGATQAGIITRGDLTAETDIVNTGGTVVQAHNFGNTGAVTVNGIAHASSNSTYTPVNFSGPYGDPNPGAFTGDMFTLLDGIAGTNNANEPGTLTVGGLTPGQDYLFQAYWIVKDNFASRKMNVTFEGDALANIDANPDTSQAVLISYDYTAGDSTLNATFTGTGGDENGWICGYSLQTNGPPPPPPPTTLQHRYSFSETGGSGTTLIDTVGGAHGTIVEVGGNDATVGFGQVTLTGGAKGSSDYVDLPDGILSSHASATIEVWATQHDVRNWSRIFDFGQDTTNNLLMSWTRATNINQDRLGFKIGNVEHLLNEPNAPYTLDQEFHVVLVIDDDRAPNGDTQLQVFRDGVYRGRLNTPYDLAQLNDVNNWLGRSQYGDETANASWNEFRIYDGALTTTQIRDNFADGPDALSLLPSGPVGLRAGPIHRWSFEETGGAGTSLIDSIGGAHGTIIDDGPNDATVGFGQVTLAGGAKADSDYVALPAGLISGLNDVTIETWATQHTVQNWSRIFDFGQDTTNNLLMAWTRATNPNQDRAGMKIGNVEQSVDDLMAPYLLDQEYHIAMVLEENFVGAQTMISLFRDGEFMGGRLIDYTVSQLLDNNNWLGRSQYGDATANASWNEFRIYDYALTDEELLGNFLAGPDIYYVIPEPASLALVGLGALALARRRRRK